MSILGDYFLEKKRLTLEGRKQYSPYPNNKTPD